MMTALGFVGAALLASLALPPSPMLGAPVGGTVSLAAPTGPRTASAATGYQPPLSGQLRVLRPFQPPPLPYQAGHLGVDLAASSGARVLAAAAGTVRFAGSVAGRGVVVIVHPDGISTEYEPVTPVVHAGTAVGAGQLIGQLAGSHRGCQPASCLHWGARRATHYLDPLGLLGRPVTLGPVRLVPWSFTLPDTQARG